MTHIFPKRTNLLYRTLSCFIAVSFVFNVVLPPGYAQVGTGRDLSLLNLPAPGTMVSLSAGFTPALVRGMTIHPDNPLQFDFFVSKGDAPLAGEALKAESKKLIKYFLASLTVPEEELWVNLSPYEKDRIIPQGFGETEMGRDLLAQDYILKQLTASLMYPEEELGKKFWDKVYRQARAKYGTAEIPVDTFNKVWIVPEKAVVYEHGDSVFVVESRLKVMLEQDYVAMNSIVGNADLRSVQEQSGVPTEIIREIIIPALEKEVNEGKSFASLRQIYNSSILAVWYKQKFTVGTGRGLSLLGQVYVNQNKTKGIDVEDKTVKEKIYSRYLEAFKKGVYNYIKEDYDPATRGTIPRKYFSGGTNLASSLVLVRISPETWGEYSLETQKRILAAMGEGVQGVRWIGVENADDETIAQAESQRPEAPKKPLETSSSPVEDMVRIISWIAGEIRSQELAPAEEREIRDGRFTTIFTSNDAVQWGLTSDQAFTLLHKLGVTTVVEQTDWDRGIWRIGLPDKNGLIQQVQSQVTELEKYRETVVSAWNKSNGETDLYSQRFQSARIEDMKRLDIEISQLNNKIDELRNQKTSSSPVLSAKTRENSVTGAMAKTFEKSQKEMEWMAGIFSEVTGVSLQKIQEEIANEIYRPIYQALNEIADYAQRGDINPASVRLRLSSHDPEITEQPAMERVPRVLYLPMKGDPWQVGHLFVILESIAKYKLDKVIVGIDNSDPIRKPDVSSLTIREAITREILNSLGDMIEYTPIAKEEEKLFAADGETMIFYLMSLNKNQAIDWYYLAGSDHRHWDTKKKHPETGEEVALPDTAHKLFNFMNQGLDGFQKGGKHTVSLILSQRNGEPVTDEELSLLKDRSGLREVGKIVQLMDTSSTRVRKNGHFWTVPFSAYQYAKAFEMWGVETEKIKREQQELALRLKFYVVAKLRGWLEQEDPEERIKQDLPKATGLGMNEFDSFLMKQFAGTDEQQLSGQDKQWLQGIRNLVFQRGEEIVKSAASSPAAAVDEIARREVPGILREMNEVYGLTRSEAARLTGNPFAQIGFDGDANRMGWNLDYLNWILQNPAMLEQTLSDAQNIREKYENVIFIGMGGSGLGVEVIKSTFGKENGPRIFSLRTTDPAVVAELTKQLAESSGGDLKAALRKTKIEVISKTFTTQEVLENRQYFEGLYRDLGIENVSSHFTLVTDPGSKLDIKAAQDAGYEVRYIQLNKGTDIGGRNTTFTNINLLPLAILAPERVMPFLQEAREMNQKSGVQEDTFAVLGIYLHYMATQYAQRKDKVTFLVPEELRALPMWSEQLIEESLGKDGKGITVVYGEDLTAQRLQNPRFTKDRVFLRFNLGGKVTRPDLADVLFGREDVFDINVESIDQIGGLMLGLQRTVAIIAQRWNTNFVNQPGVQGYKTATDEEMAKLKLKPGKRVEISSNWEYGTFDKLKIYYTPFIEAGIITKEELEREAAGLGSDLKDGAAVYAALIHIARETGKFELAEIASYGHMNPAVWNVMQKARTDIFTDRLAMASKLGEGPDRNHSFHQSVEQGPDYHLSTYLMPLETTQPQHRKYDENPLRAQTLGTVKSLINARRKAILISIDGKIADSELVLGKFFEQVDNLLGASSPAGTETRPLEQSRPSSFGTSGDRGIIGKDFDFPLIHKLAEGTALYARQTYTPGQATLIGRDTRRMNAEFQRETAAIHAANGIPVIVIEDEPIPTPVLAFLAGSDDNIGGVINLTASHSPYTDGGFKFSPRHGGAADQKTTDRIQELSNAAANYQILDYEEAKKQGLIKVITAKDAVDQYVHGYIMPILRGTGALNDIVSYVKSHPDFELVLDPMQGTGVRVMQTLYTAIAKEAGRGFFIVINENDKDPEFKDVNGAPQPDKSTSNGKLIQKVREKKGRFGLSVDGDVDRFGTVDFTGEFFGANDLIALLAFFLKKDVGLDGAIGKTVATSDFVNAVSGYLGSELDEEKVGFKWFVAKITNGRKYLVAGEESAHVGVGPFMKTFDDGFAVGLTALWMVAKSGMSLAQYKDKVEAAIKKRFVAKPGTIRREDIDAKQGTINIVREVNAELSQGKQAAELTFAKKIEAKTGLKADNVMTKDGVKLFFEGGNASVLLRPSGTEPAGKLYTFMAFPYEVKPDLEKLNRLYAVVQDILFEASPRVSSPITHERSLFDEEEFSAPPASSPVGELPHEVEMLNFMDRSRHWVVNMTKISAPGAQKRIEVINEDGTTTPVFLRAFEYKIGRGTDEFGRLTSLSDDSFIYVDELSISEKYSQKGIGFTVYNWLAHQALENGRTLRMRTRDAVELQLSQEMLTDIKVGSIGNAFVPLMDPAKHIMEDPNVQRFLKEGKDVEVHGRANPPLPVVPPGPEMIRKISSLDVAGKKVFLRVDHNGTFQDGKVTSKQRINANTPTVAQLFENGARLVIMATHAEKPKGQVVEKMSPRPVAEYLKGVFRGVRFMARGQGETPEGYLARVKDFIDTEKPQGILYLDNLRFDPREQSDKPEERLSMARQLKALADVYINDAFSVDHRADTSVYDLAYQFTPEQRAGGSSFLKELENLYRFEGELRTLRIPHESLAVIAGSKLGGKEGKLHLLKGFSNRVNKLRVEGLLAVTFLKMEAQKLGRYDIALSMQEASARLESLKAGSADESEIKTAKKKLDDLQGEVKELREAEELMEFFNTHKALGYVAPSIVSDFMAVPRVDLTQPPVKITREEFLSGARKLEEWTIIDTGPEELATLKREARDSALVFWNGSLGWTDMPAKAGFNPQYGQKATWDFAQYLSLFKGKVKVAIGGGNTIADAQSAGLTLEDAFDVVLLGGGASQEFLIQVPLPGIQPLLNVPSFTSPYAASSSSPVTIDEEIRALEGELEKIKSYIAKAKMTLRLNEDAEDNEIDEMGVEMAREDLEVYKTLEKEKLDEIEKLKKEKSGQFQAASPPGGIDLNPALLDLQIRRDANFVPLPLPQQPIGGMRIDGFTPVIINITPVSNLPMLLGIADDELPADAADSARSAPMTLGFAIKEN